MESGTQFIKNLLVAKDGYLEEIILDFEIFKSNKKFEWLTIDLTYVKDHRYSSGTHGVNQGISNTKRVLNSKMYLVVNEYAVPINLIVTDGWHIDCKEAIF